MVWLFSHHHREGVLNLELLDAAFIRLPKQPLGKEHNWFAFFLTSGRGGNTTRTGHGIQRLKACHSVVLLDNIVFCELINESFSQRELR